MENRKISPLTSARLQNERSVSNLPVQLVTSGDASGSRSERTGRGVTETDGCIQRTLESPSTHEINTASPFIFQKPGPKGSSKMSSFAEVKDVSQQLISASDTRLCTMKTDTVRGETVGLIAESMNSMTLHEESSKHDASHRTSVQASSELVPLQQAPPIRQLSSDKLPLSNQITLQPMPVEFVPLHLMQLGQTSPEAASRQQMPMEEDSDADLESPNPLYIQDKDGDTVLHLSIISERYLDTLLLIEFAPLHSKSLDLCNSLRQTPLHLATIRRQPVVIRQLLKRGANRRVYDKRGDTPLHIACRNGHMDCVQELTRGHAMTEQSLNEPIDLSSELEQPNYEGQTCLHLAAVHNCLPVLQHLIENCSADINQKELKRGCSILHRAVQFSIVDLVSYLVHLSPSFGLFLDESTYDGYTALQMAQLIGQNDIVQLLLGAGAKEDRDIY